MAGTLNVTTISGISTLTADSGVLATQNGMTGIAKAWVNFYYTGSAISIRNSFNVLSVTYNATGDYSVTFTTAMANANYASLVSGSPPYTVGPGPICVMNSSAAGVTQQDPTTSAFRFGMLYPNGTAYNPTYVMASVFGS
jgi:hypothetical protein